MGMKTLARILLVEDSPNDVEMTLEAFAERVPGNPAVILLDLKLPKIGGKEVLRRIRADETLKHVPVVIMTFSREERDISEGYQLGVNAYVVKPVDFPDFVESVKGLGIFWAAINQPPPGCAGRSVLA